MRPRVRLVLFKDSYYQESTELIETKMAEGEEQEFRGEGTLAVTKALLRSSISCVAGSQMNPGGRW